MGWKIIGWGRYQKRNKWWQKAQWQIGRVCREFPFRFKAVCSPSSYLSRVIYFLISLSLPSLPLSLSRSLWIYLVVTWTMGGKRKVNKSLWRQLSPPPIGLLSPSCIISPALPSICLCTGAVLLLPISSSIDCFLFQILFHIIGLQAIPTPLQRSILILFSVQTASPVLRNYKIRKLLDTTLVSSSERFRYTLESSQRLTEAGELWPAVTKPRVDFLDQQRNSIWFHYTTSLTTVLKTQGEFTINEEYICAPHSVHLASYPIPKPHDDLLTIQLWLSVANIQRMVMSSVKLQVFIMYARVITQPPSIKTGIGQKIALINHLYNCSTLVN